MFKRHHRNRIARPLTEETVEPDPKATPPEPVEEVKSDAQTKRQRRARARDKKD